MVVVLSRLSVSVVICSLVDVCFAGRSIAGCNISVGATDVHGGALMKTINCLSYLSGSICRRIVLVLMILPEMPMTDSLVIVSLPKKLAWCGIMYCTISPISHSGVLCTLFHLLK